MDFAKDLSTLFQRQITSHSCKGSFCLQELLALLSSCLWRSFSAVNIFLFQGYHLLLSVVLKMKTELIWLQHLISTDLELFRIVLYQKISGNIYRHNSRCVLDYKEGWEIRSFNGNLLQWWTKKSKNRKLHPISRCNTPF